jgi:hypothetical protein
MSDSNNKRPMTAKRFATAKLSGKTTAEGFLAAHMLFLRNQTFLDPILDAYVDGIILPTPTLQAVQSALMTHVLESERLTQEQKLLAREEKEQSRKSKVDDGEPGEEEQHSKGYTITLFVKSPDPESIMIPVVGTLEEITGYRIRTPEGDKDVDTKEEASSFPILETYRRTVPAVWEADTFNRAVGLADRRLFGREDSLYAEIVNNFDTPVTTTVPRGDAIARMLKSKKGPVSHVRGRSTKSLSFGVHAKQSRVVGPWSGR